MFSDVPESYGKMVADHFNAVTGIFDILCATFSTYLFLNNYKKDY